MTAPTPRKLSALIGCTDEWMCRSLETVFEERRFEVARSVSGKQALKLARRGAFDVIMLDEHMDELSGLGVCEALRDDPLFDHATPIVMISQSHTTLPSRNRAYSAGAWEYCHQPVDFDALFLKLGTFLRARQHLAASQARTLMDPASGLYTTFGLQHLAEQLGARALRNHEPFACVAFSPEQDASTSGQRSSGDDGIGAFDDAAQVVHEQSRKSDVLARTGAHRLSMLAPDTDAEGARLLVARLQRALDAASRNKTIPGSVRLRAGYCAVSDLAAAKVDLAELIHRAERALADVPATGVRGAVVSFDDLLLS
jgi:PleD family two-component response regulator